jgi:hypothetical protein
VPAFVVVAVVGLLSCRHTPEELRLHCLRGAHQTVKVPESDSSNRAAMIHEVYLRCLDVYGIQDAPSAPGGSAPNPATP